MKILLDECLPLDFRHSFPDHDAHTAEWAGLKGKKNGELLRTAETAGYKVNVTKNNSLLNCFVSLCFFFPSYDNRDGIQSGTSAFRPFDCRVLSCERLSAAGPVQPFP